jgi:hypothetical protein
MLGRQAEGTAAAMQHVHAFTELMYSIWRPVSRGVFGIFLPPGVRRDLAGGPGRRWRLLTYSC